MAALAVLSIAGCGGDDSQVDLATSSLVENEELPRAVIDDGDRDRYEEGSAEMALLDYWEALQFQDLGTAVAHHDAEARRAIGEDELFAALRSQGVVYRTTKPGIVGTSTEGGLTTIRFLVQDLSGEQTPQSIVWRRQGDDWRIVYSSYLGDSLVAVVEAQTQAGIDPSAQTPSAQAEEAGAEAARRQEAVLARALREAG
ncbi:MAG: hypothetical protein ACRDL6_11325 [Solirubrobacterales bacterium]